jgi:ATP-dependent DNA helicase RecG
MIENKNKEYKSLRKVIGKSANLKSLAETCVCFANAQGGEIIIGIEDKNSLPPEGQKISRKEMNKVISALRSLTDGVGIANHEIMKSENGGEFFTIKILPSTRIIATTTSGKVFIRVSDNCFPVGNEELTDLAAEKTAFQWEIIVPKKLTLKDADEKQVKKLIDDLKKSDKVSDFIKEKEDVEILEFY